MLCYSHRLHCFITLWITIDAHTCVNLQWTPADERPNIPNITNTQHSVKEKDLRHDYMNMGLVLLRNLHVKIHVN